VAVVAAPDIEREQALGHGAYALFIFALPFLGSALLEAAAALIAERCSRRRLVGWGLMACGAALALCALSANGVLLALGLTLAGAASGLACTAGQIELVARHPGGRERAMTRWVLCGGIGDVLTPVFVALVLHLGGSYRAAFAATALWTLLHALSVLRTKPAHANDAASTPPARDAAPASDSEPYVEASEPAEDAEDAEDAAAAPLLEALRASLSNGRLWLALVGCNLCLFLDEVVVAFAALHAETALGASPSAAVACVGGGAIGSVLGAAYTDRLLSRVAPDRLLSGSACAALAALLAVLLAPDPLWLGLALLVLGAAAAPHYALLKAKAYAAVPGRPGLVNALSQVFVTIEIGAPLLLGALADRYGLTLALACLAIQPLGVLLVLLIQRRPPTTASP